MTILPDELDTHVDLFLSKEEEGSVTELLSHPWREGAPPQPEQFPGVDLENPPEANPSSRGQKSHHRALGLSLSLSLSLSLPGLSEAQAGRILTCSPCPSPVFPPRLQPAPRCLRHLPIISPCPGAQPITGCPAIPRSEPPKTSKTKAIMFYFSFGSTNPQKHQIPLCFS